MAANAGKQMGKNVAIQVAKGPFGVEKKYTVQSTGIWERFRRVLSVDPNRSNGVPLNAQFRNPTPGGGHPEDYTDPVTVPAGDIAENPYWKRDMRRSYPKPSVVDQGTVVGLLQLGSRTKPREDVPLIGDAGTKQLVAIKEEGEKGLAALFVKDSKSVSTAVLGPNGLPPSPMGHNLKYPEGRRPYVMEPEEDQTYGGNYPCRTFT